MTSTSTPAAARDTFTCDCTVCGGLTITAPAGYITSKTAKGLRDQIHNYAQGAHAPAGIGRIMADRAGIVAA